VGENCVGGVGGEIDVMGMVMGEEMGFEDPGRGIPT